MKKIVSLVLAISMVLSMCVTAFAATGLKDIANTKYEGAVEALVELGVVAGYPDGSYKPEKEVNRAELAKLIVICMGLEEDADRAQYQTMFADESLTANGNFAWAKGYVNTAAAAGVIKGYPDGTFGPERTVTYAEAVTMMLRALGYGNVMEAEGTWPTNAIMKAKELEMFDDVDVKNASTGAVRGDIAILLWNMLKTPMWKITSENQGTGMTSTVSKMMINVKFPNYQYVEDYYLAGFDVENDEVTVTINAEKANAIEGQLLSGDLSRLVPGMKVSALYNKKTEKFLMVHCEDTLVEGITEAAKNKNYDIRIDDKDYRLGDDVEAVAEKVYVVAVVDGKEITAVRELPMEGKIGLVTNEKSVQRKIGEDAIVVIDGKWATNEDVREGDYVVEVEGYGDKYYEVARERVDGTFESMKREEDEKDSILSIDVDGKEYVALEDLLGAFKGEENDEDVELDYLLETKKADNEYLDHDVELVLNYLGQVVRMHFGEVDGLEAKGNFYVLTSDGAWDESSSKGATYYVELEGADGKDTYAATKKSAVSDLLDSTYYEGMATKEYKNGKYEEKAEDAVKAPEFYYVKLNDKGQVKSMEVLAAGEFGDYKVVAFDAEITDDGYVGDYKVTASTIVFTATPVLDADGQVEAVELEITKGKDALDGVEKGLVAYKKDATTPKAAFVFVTDDAKSTKLSFGKVTKYQLKSGILSLYIDGTRLVVDEDEDMTEEEAEALVGNMVAYTDNEAGIAVKAVLKATDLDNAVVGLVTKVEDEFVTIEGLGTKDTTLDEVKDQYKHHEFVLGNVTIDKDGDLVFDEGAESLGKGIDAKFFKKNDRVVVNEANKLVVIVRGLKNVDEIVDGSVAPEATEEAGE